MLYHFVLYLLHYIDITLCCIVLSIKYATLRYVLISLHLNSQPNRAPDTSSLSSKAETITFLTASHIFEQLAPLMVCYSTLFSHVTCHEILMQHLHIILKIEGSFFFCILQLLLLV